MRRLGQTRHVASVDLAVNCFSRSEERHVGEIVIASEALDLYKFFVCVLYIGTLVVYSLGILSLIPLLYLFPFIVFLFKRITEPDDS